MRTRWIRKADSIISRKWENETYKGFTIERVFVRYYVNWFYKGYSHSLDFKTLDSAKRKVRELHRKLYA